LPGEATSSGFAATNPGPPTGTRAGACAVTVIEGPQPIARYSALIPHTLTKESKKKLALPASLIHRLLHNGQCCDAKPIFKPWFLVFASPTFGLGVGGGRKRRKEEEGRRRRRLAAVAAVMDNGKNKPSQVRRNYYIPTRPLSPLYPYIFPFDPTGLHAFTLTERVCLRVGVFLFWRLF